MALDAQGPRFRDKEIVPIRFVAGMAGEAVFCGGVWLARGQGIADLTVALGAQHPRFRGQEGWRVRGVGIVADQAILVGSGHMDGLRVGIRTVVTIHADLGLW